ncbi:reverse transcriptase [Caerostris extrusa]|uniref:Reverse transcriptase n=1 Tax=Caerostris extrusa TaxID=172846 RepID=A0AAV4SN28_CAEEX|nr:reverse transcriptase [Caerostris extrusa]
MLPPIILTCVDRFLRRPEAYSLVDISASSVGIDFLYWTGFQVRSSTSNYNRQLKAAIRSHSTSQWSTVLPTIHLGFRAAWKEEPQATTTEMLYGTLIRLSGEFLSPLSSTIDPTTLVGKLRETMQELLPLTHRQQAHRAVFVSKDLSSYSHVFLRSDTTKKGLQPPCEVPFRVLRRSEKVFKLLSSVVME